MHESTSAEIPYISGLQASTYTLIGLERNSISTQLHLQVSSNLVAPRALAALT